MPRRLPPPTGLPRRSRAGARRSLVRRVELPPFGVPRLGRLTALKAKQGTTVSLVLPTLNEAETIGPIVERALKEMVERPLLDEVLVIDSDSDDRTRQIATDAGARVVSHPRS